MPVVNGKLITPDAAIAQELCPECGVSLKTTNAIAELNSHWQAPIPKGRPGAEPLRRQALLQGYIKAHNITTVAV